ncbi:hypothetical protein WJ01_15680 [Burkholderia vietnamiensis]|uniref:hypothetical protein n=1 Tax=Burkholderia vietnamiensis TaxID=60552 RepID=UPI00075EFB9D|nr:hypothetical protein [Burkholderia vietnamiensis]KVE95044.1 hypothetical protein WJ01_15680 [Burkholderia vietnamiensis]
MTRGERPGDSPAGRPKPSWGPGRNAALSVVAFAAIFGAFALVERNPGRGHASIARDVAGEIGTAVGKYRNAFVAASAPGGAASTAALSASLIPPASDAEAAAAPQADAGSAPKPPRGADPRHAPHAALATSPHDTSGGARVTDTGDTHRTSRSPAPGHTRRHRAAASQLRHPPQQQLPVQPPAPAQSYLTDAARMETTSVTHDELASARALARARRCAQLDQWQCVEQNASRALAIDPTNSESRALLGQAIRNRL